MRLVDIHNFSFLTRRDTTITKNNSIANFSRFFLLFVYNKTRLMSTRAMCMFVSVYAPILVRGKYWITISFSGSQQENVHGKPIYSTHTDMNANICQGRGRNKCDETKSTRTHTSQTKYNFRILWEAKKLATSIGLRREIWTERKTETVTVQKQRRDEKLKR